MVKPIVKLGAISAYSIDFEHEDTTLEAVVAATPDDEVDSIGFSEPGIRLITAEEAISLLTSHEMEEEAQAIRSQFNPDEQLAAFMIEAEGELFTTIFLKWDDPYTIPLMVAREICESQGLKIIKIEVILVKD